MASRECVRDSVTGTVDAGVLDVLRLHTEAAGSQMLDPRVAAASARVLVDRNHRIWLPDGAGQSYRRQGQNHQDSSSFHCVLQDQDPVGLKTRKYWLGRNACSCART
jgi:hypothetical protein